MNLGQFAGPAAADNNGINGVVIPSPTWGAEVIFLEVGRDVVASFFARFRRFGSDQDICVTVHGIFPAFIRSRCVVRATRCPVWAIFVALSGPKYS